MIKKTIGAFELKVSDPWPEWVSIKMGGQEIHGIHPDDLRDLEYAIKCAMQEVWEK